MNKILIILFLFLFSNTSYANDAKIDEFNNWLFENGHTEYLNIEQKAGCKKLIQKYGLKEPVEINQSKNIIGFSGRTWT